MPDILSFWNVVHNLPEVSRDDFYGLQRGEQKSELSAFVGMGRTSSFQYQNTGYTLPGLPLQCFEEQKWTGLTAWLHCLD